MRKSKFFSFFTALIMFTSCFSGTNIIMAEKNTSVENYKVFNFAAKDIDGAINLYDEVPEYSEATSFGFVYETSAMPSRKLNKNIVWSSEGFSITENGTGLSNVNTAQYNYGGLTFRIDLEEAGAYGLTVKLANSTKKNTYVATNGMDASRITGSSNWDSAGLVPIKTHASWVDDTTWKYDFVAGQKFIEIEVEPSTLASESKPQTVGIATIEIVKYGKNTRAKNELPTVYILGDSTEKSYTFEEAGMSGWGQIINRMFDLSKVNVINYSMGGRSMKAMFTENRFNDVLMNANEGDFVFIHSAHNDESAKDDNGPHVRFGRGSTTETYTKWLEDIYIPSMKARGLHPVLVSAMPRTNDGSAIEKFNPDSPAIMEATANADAEVEFVDLFNNAKTYISEIGKNHTLAIYMGLEAGESPGKTNSGSYANGNPSNKADGTHYKEVAAKAWCQIIADQIAKNAKKENASNTAKELASYLKDDVKTASESGDWNTVFPERANDVSYVAETDEGSYYRNQIEKLIQLGVMFKDNNNNFNPSKNMKTNDFISALCAVWNIDLTNTDNNTIFQKYYNSGDLTREVMAAIILDAYKLRFGVNSDGTYKKPKYMTDYNGNTISPDDPTYDPNLTGAEAQYYPLVGWGNLTDKDDISLEYAQDFYDVYNLGLMRSENGIQRGSMKNGTLLEPKTVVTRAKAAKEIWFLWALGQTNVKAENQITTITTDGSTYVTPVYNAVNYTAPKYEFSSVNIAGNGDLSITLNKTTSDSSSDKLIVKVFDKENKEISSKEIPVSASGAVSEINTTVSKGQYALLKVVNSSNSAISIERKVVRTELVVPVRSYSASTVAGIRNGSISLEVVNAENISLESVSENNSVSLDATTTDIDGTTWWTASADVTKGEEVMPGLTATYDMTFKKSTTKVNNKSFEGYVAHASQNGYANGSGSGFKYVPKEDGVLTAYVGNLGANKNFIIVEVGKDANSAIASSQTPTIISGNCTISGFVEAGKEYYVTGTGTKARYVAVSFTSGAPSVSVMAKPNETVKISATPNEGYYTSKISISDEKGNVISCNDISSNEKTFVMPASNVTISAEFAKGTSTDPTSESTTESSTENTTEASFGDVNANGTIDVNDAVITLTHVLDSGKIIFDDKTSVRADVDGDNIITSKDVSAILEKVLNSNFKFKVEK